MNVKELVGRKAADYVESGMTVGLGTGSTAYYFVDELGRRYNQGTLKDIVCVTTSIQTAEQAQRLNLPLTYLDQVEEIDVLVDGADECTIDFKGIKGGGGALLHEKMVAEYSKKIIWIVGEDKVVEKLGAFPLPVEVIQFGSWKTFHALEELGCEANFRKVGEDNLFITDSGNYIIDLELKEIDDPYELSNKLIQKVGVVEHGLFLDYADTILIGKSDGTVEVLEK